MADQLTVNVKLPVISELRTVRHPRRKVTRNEGESDDLEMISKWIVEIEGCLTLVRAW
jgi:hypothetical protein